MQFNVNLTVWSKSYVRLKFDCVRIFCLSNGKSFRIVIQIQWSTCLVNLATRKWAFDPIENIDLAQNVPHPSCLHTILFSRDLVYAISVARNRSTGSHKLWKWWLTIWRLNEVSFLLYCYSFLYGLCDAYLGQIGVYVGLFGTHWMVYKEPRISS